MNGLSLNASTVAAVAQGLLTAVMAGMLARGARTAARKSLARALGWLTAYAACIFVSFSATHRVVDLTGSFLALTCGMFATQSLSAYASWLAKGAAAEEPPSVPRVVRALAPFVVVAALGGVAAAWSDNRLFVRLISITINLTLLGVFAYLGLTLRAASRRGVPGAKSLIRACVWPVVAIVSNIGMAAALAAGLPAPVATYYVVRDVSLLFFAFGILAAYLDDGHEPMSLHARLVAGTLTIVAAVVTTSVHLLEPWGRSAVAEAQRAAAASDVAWRSLVVLGVGTALVFGLLPRLFRRNVLEPVAALVNAVEAIERGEVVDLPAGRQDEMGRLSRSFNTMSRALADGRHALEEKVRQLETRQQEVEALNEELRHQIAKRSQSIAETLGHKPLTSRVPVQATTIGDRYRVIRQLGHGAMGVVYEVLRTSDDRKLALKMLAPAASGTDAIRLAREAEIAATVSHDNLVGVVDVGVQDGSVFLVMDLVEGGSLEAARDRFGDFAFARTVISQVARGLDALHKHGVVHRDLKPANVLFEESDGRLVVKIADFGIARMDAVEALGGTVPIDPTVKVMALTKTGFMMGTISYMAPELARGAPVRATADIFAFGVLAYEVVMGKYPFRVAPVLAVLTDQDPPAMYPLDERVPADLRAVLSGALDTAPERRPTAAQIVEMLGTS